MLIPVVSVIALCALSSADSPAPVAPLVQPVAAVRLTPNVADAQAQLQAASKIRRSANKKDPEEKRRILLDAVDAYQEVLSSFEDDADAGAEAAFRIGEIQRSLGDASAARVAFEQTVARGESQPKLAARALIELAHLNRRAGDLNQAIIGFERVLADYPSQDAQGATALTWIGKIEAKRGDEAAAREVWTSIMDRIPSQPIPAIRAADLAALSSISAGDAVEATRIVALTRERFSAENKNQEWWSPKVEEALGKMKSADRLQIPETAPPGKQES